jgi:hypothetical protein
MNRLFQITASVALAFSTAGCINWHHVNEKPSVTTGYPEDREERMSAIVDDLKAKGYSEERAKQVASKEVPALETTYSESLADIVSGAAQKRKDEQEKFEKDLANSTNQK